MQPREVLNNTPEQVRQYLADALALVDELEVPSDLREAVFLNAVSLISSKRLEIPQQVGIDLAALRGMQG